MVDVSDGSQFFKTICQFISSTFKKPRYPDRLKKKNDFFQSRWHYILDIEIIVLFTFFFRVTDVFFFNRWDGKAGRTGLSYTGHDNMIILTQII